jgi:hypothetical protein
MNQPSNTTTLTEERGKHYGHPRDHFATTRGLFLVWESRRNKAIEESKNMVPTHEEALRHAVYMICDKLARLANDPTHKDNLDDIQGYARTAKMVLGMEQ